MGKDKLINLIVLVLIVAGCVALGLSMLYTKQADLAVIARKVVAFGSVPFGLLIKGLQFVANEREKLNVRLDAIARSVTDNRTSIDVLRADTEARREDSNRQNSNLLVQLDQLSDEYHDAIRALDRRLVIQEARSGLSQRIGELEQSVKDINNLLLQRNDKE